MTDCETPREDDEKNCLKQQQSITITITINQKANLNSLKSIIKYLDVRVRGHSRFLRRRGDFVDLHFNNLLLFTCVLKEEEKGKRREREKKRLKKV